jgi:AcrR family transcriptional regulator
LIVHSKQPSGAETRERILEVAARLFHEQGFAATGVATILRGAGVHSGSLYHFFPGKDALLVGVMERHLDRLRPTILDPAERATDHPLGRVFALLGVYRRDLLISRCTRGCPVGNLALEVGDRKPEVRALIEEYFSRWVRRVRRWLDAASSQLPPDLDRLALAGFVLTVMEGAVMQARATGSLAPFDASVGQLRAHFEDLTEQARRGSGEAVGLAATARDIPSVESAEVPRLDPLAPEGDESGADRSAWRSW